MALIPYFQLGERQKRRHRASLNDHIRLWNQEISQFGLFVSKVQFSPFSVNNTKTRLVFDNKKKEHDVIKILKMKDQVNLSDRAYHQFKKSSCRDWPPLNKIKEHRNRLNQMFPVISHGKGFYVDVNEKLKGILSLIKGHCEFQTPNEFRLKFCGDCTNIGKTVKVLNFGFQCIDEKLYCTSAKGFYCIGIFLVTNENYEELKNCLEPIFNQIAEINEIQIDDKVYKLDKMLCGDLKFLSIIMGIKSANSKYPCIWCKISKQEFSNLDNEMPLNHNSDVVTNFKKARDHEDASIYIGKRQDFGYARVAIANKIPFHKVVVDLLHLFLRITDKLTNLFISSLRDLDRGVGFNRQSDERNLSMLPNIQKYINFLEIEIKVGRSWYMSDKQIEFRDLTGEEKERLFEKMDVPLLFPNHPQRAHINIIWKQFWNIYQNIKHKMISPDIIKRETSQWLKNFLTVYSSEEITPYMHIFVCHIHDFNRNFIDIHKYNMEGVEKANHNYIQTYFASTNKNVEDYKFIRQMIQKRNRIEIYDFIHNVQL